MKVALVSGALRTDCIARHLSTCDFNISLYNFNRSSMQEGESMSSTLERLQKLFMARFHFKKEELEAATTLEYLGLDSLNIIEIMFDIENEFKIRVPDQELRELAVSTIQDMVDALDRFISEQAPGQAIGTSSRN
jgi:acyl carrier protein